MGRPKRSNSELVELLAEQRQALAASCEGYDRGNEWEAARLATAVFTLVHDGGAIVSLLTQLGVRGSLRFVSSGRVEDQPNLISMSPPLLQIKMLGAQGVKFAPKFDIAPHHLRDLQFITWWEKEIINRDTAPDSMLLTRKRLVFSLRHQDGGGHVGELTDKSYVFLKGGSGWFGGVEGGPPSALDTAATATMRQVAWEITKTLDRLGEIA